MKTDLVLYSSLLPYFVFGKCQSYRGRSVDRLLIRDAHISIERKQNSLRSTKFYSAFGLKTPLCLNQRQKRYKVGSISSLLLVKHVFPTFSRNAKISISSYEILSCAMPILAF